MSTQCIPNEDIPAMEKLTTLLPLDPLLIYLGTSLSNFTVDKDNRTITMSQAYTYNADTISSWRTQIEQYETAYKSALASKSADYEMLENDRVLFVQIYKWIDYIEGIIS